MNRLLSLLAMLGLMLFASPAPACGLVGASAVQYGYGMQLAQASYYQTPQLALPQLALAPYCPPLVLQTPQLAVPQQVEIPQLPQFAPAPYCPPALGLVGQSYAPALQFQQFQGYNSGAQFGQVGYGSGVQLNVNVNRGRFFRGGSGVFLNTVDPGTGLVVNVNGRRGGRGVIRTRSVTRTRTRIR